MALTKGKLTLHLQAHLGLDKRESQQMVACLLEIIRDRLSQKEDVLISGFGKFCVRQKNARRGRNPQTNESLTLAARNVLVFKTSGVLRKRINEDFKPPEERLGKSKGNNNIAGE